MGGLCYFTVAPITILGMTDTAPARSPARMPLLTALGAQAVAGLMVFGGNLILDFTPPLIGALALQGVLAAGLSYFLGLASWWIPIQLILPAAVAWALVWQVPGWVFLAGFLVTLGVFWNSARSGVPLYLSNRKTKEVLAGLVPEKEGFRFADLGCGVGGPVITLAQGRPDGHFTGVETAPILFVAAWLRNRLFGGANAEIIFTDYRKLDLGPFDCVYCFLSPVPMPDVYEKARREMRPGSLLISNSFVVPGYPADEIIEVGDGRKTRLHLWRM